MSLNLAKNSIKNETMTNFFPEKEKSHLMNLRNTEKYEVFRANTDRMRESSVIYMQNLLNSDHKAKQEEIR